MYSRPGQCRNVNDPRFVLCLNRKGREDRQETIGFLVFAQRRGEVLAARKRPGTTGPRNRSKYKHSARFLGPAACASAGLASSPHLFGRGKRQNRRTRGASAGETTGCDECLHSGQTDFLPATGDPIACSSANGVLAGPEPADASDSRPTVRLLTNRWAARWRRCVTVAVGRA